MRPAKINLGIVKFCAEEVERQGRGPLQVWNMVEAWDWAKTHLTKTDPLWAIQFLGYLVEPENNSRRAWRSVNVTVGGYLAPQPNELQALMHEWSENFSSKYAEDAYRRFEEIHPFLDGNGRVGKIIYNWLKGTLDAPVLPPNYFNCSNP